MLNDPEFNREFSKGIVALMMECVAPIQKENAELKAKLIKHSEAIDALLARPIHKEIDPAEVVKIVLQSIKGPNDKDVSDCLRHLFDETDKIYKHMNRLSYAMDELPKNETFTAFVNERIEKLLADMPKPRDGVSPDIADIAALVLKSVQMPKDGKDGANGKDGQSPDVADVAALVLKSIQLPKDGAPGRDGKDGVGLAGAIINRSGELVITTTNGNTQNLGIVVGKDGAEGPKGKDGAAGRDGFGFDDMEAIEEGLRFGHRFRRGDLVKEFWYTKPTLADFDHEIWREGTCYPRGAVVTLGGSLYICKQETKQRPETASGAKDWRLAVKCGRHGSNGAMGPMGPPGPPGKDGRMVGFDNRPL